MIVTVTTQRSLLAPTGDAEAERAAHDEDPRPGVWAGEPSADLRALTQDETDILIRTELASWLPLSSPERAEVEQIIGRPRRLMVGVPPNRSPAAQQRGGIDSDPLVRLLAWRAWGDRDRRWFEERGVRKGDKVTRLPGRAQSVVAAAWSGDGVIGIAAHDAQPGEEIRVVLGVVGQLPMFAGDYAGPAGPLVAWRVGDRLRAEPERPGRTEEQELCAEFGFDLLVIERDPTTQRTTLTADRDGHAERLAVADEVLVSASARSEALRGCCRELDAELARQGAPRRDATRSVRLAQREIERASTSMAGLATGSERRPELAARIAYQRPRLRRQRNRIDGAQREPELDLRGLAVSRELVEQAASGLGIPAQQVVDELVRARERDRQR